MYKLFCFEAFIYIIVLDLLQSFKRRSQAKIKIQVKIILLEQTHVCQEILNILSMLFSTTILMCQKIKHLE